MLVKRFEGEKLRNVRSNPVSLLVPGNEQFFLSRWVQDVCSPCPPRSVSPAECVPHPQAGTSAQLPTGRACGASRSHS